MKALGDAKQYSPILPALDYAQWPDSLDLSALYPSKSLSLASQPKLYIPLTFFPLDYRLYSLDYLLDLGVQLNLARHISITPFLLGEINGGRCQRSWFNVFSPTSGNWFPCVHPRPSSSMYIPQTWWHPDQHYFRFSIVYLLVSHFYLLPPTHIFHDYFR